MDHSAHNHLTHMLSELNPLDLIEFISIFSFSFLSSLHCAFMCAPLVCSYLGNRGKLTSPGVWIYNMGRILSYSVAGLILGGTGEIILTAMPQLGRFLAYFLGVVLILVAMLKAGNLLRVWRIELSTPNVKLTRLVSFMNVWPTGLREFGFGFITVFLPCMTLTPVLALAATSQSSIKGALLLLAFGLGTVPVMLGATYVPLIISRKMPPFLLSWFVVLFLLAAGIVTIIR